MIRNYFNTMSVRWFNKYQMNVYFVDIGNTRANLIIPSSCPRKSKILNDILKEKYSRLN